jgi:aromatic ring-opening dioxygenase catalytic subunit (LigB family)
MIAGAGQVREIISPQQRLGGSATMSSVIGGAMLPHAPQFFTMPETEDRNTVERVKTAAAEIGTRLRELRPDLWIIFANDHVEQFFLAAAPPFTIHVGNEAKGEFAGRQFHWRVPGEIGFEIVRQMYAQGFDPAFTSVAKIDYALGIPLTHLEIADPVLPIYVNAYLPPQPPMERCYAFGQALARIVSAIGVNTVVLASGGMSHYPGTDRNAAPDLAWDREALARIAAGNLKSLVGYDANSTPPAMSNCAAGLAPRARLASASPTSSRWSRAGTTIMLHSAGSARRRRNRNRTTRQSSLNSSNLLSPCMALPMTRQAAQAFLPMPPATPTASA